MTPALPSACAPGPSAATCPRCSWPAGAPLCLGPRPPGLSTFLLFKIPVWQKGLYRQILRFGNNLTHFPKGWSQASRALWWRHLSCLPAEGPRSLCQHEPVGRWILLQPVLSWWPVSPGARTKRSLSFKTPRGICRPHSQILRTAPSHYVGPAGSGTDGATILGLVSSSMSLFPCLLPRDSGAEYWGRCFGPWSPPQFCGPPVLLCWKLFPAFTITIIIPLDRAWAICIAQSPQGTASWAGFMKGWDLCYMRASRGGHC